MNQALLDTEILSEIGEGFDPKSTAGCRVGSPFCPRGFPRWRTRMSLSRITIDPAICHGKPCVRGLRYQVEFLLELMSSGMTVEEILKDYEDLERDDLIAVLAFADTFHLIGKLGDREREAPT